MLRLACRPEPTFYFSKKRLLLEADVLTTRLTLVPMAERRTLGLLAMEEVFSGMPPTDAKCELRPWVRVPVSTFKLVFSWLATF